MQTNGRAYSVKPLESSRVTEALQFVCREFVTESVVHRAVAIKYDEYLRYMTEPFKAMAAASLSFIAVDDESNELAGCLLAGDFNVVYPNTAPVPLSMWPVKALLSELEQPYQKEHSAETGETLLVDVATVAAHARKQGLYRQLRLAAHRAAKEKGFNRVVGELSSVPTQRYCVDELGHIVVNELSYSNFSFDGRYPFAGIEHPPSIQLVEGLLS